ncbi:MAG TPA: hypothetical protein VEO54_09750 [Thermoanaerobaculia bacterium]|nr:hypothetical protein [Thermoanaerobaculia bacterium]
MRPIALSLLLGSLLSFPLAAAETPSLAGFFHQQGSGTSLMPAAAPMEMRMFNAGSWHVMLHGVAFANHIQQSGPRGGDDTFSTNWVMAAASKEMWGGAVQLRTMLSLEPATIRDKRYPLLFQTGETADGRAIIDGQHPHDFFMELAAEYARPVGGGIGYVYLAPHGDAALGPVAFPHRPSAAEIPQAVLSHHNQDSTHIASTVITTGYRRGAFALEVSGFHGAEPDEGRWDIDLGPIDSWSTRLSWAPTPNLVAQVSHGELKKPEALEPGDVARTTASVAYEHPFSRAHLSTSLVYGINHKKWFDQRLDAYLGEALLRVGDRHWISTRYERVEKDELFPHVHSPIRPPVPPVIPTFLVQSLLVGYTFDFWVRAPLRVGAGANYTMHDTPEALDPFYGEDPNSRAVFLRVRLIGG